MCQSRQDNLKFICSYLNADIVLFTSAILNLPKFYLPSVYSGLPRWFSDKESASNAWDPGSIPGSGRSPGKGDPTPIFLPGKSQGKPGGLESMGSQRVGHDLVTEQQQRLFHSF